MTSTPLTLSSLDYSRLMCVGVSCVWGVCHVTRDSHAHVCGVFVMSLETLKSDDMCEGVMSRIMCVGVFVFVYVCV